jgi:hypothetical protein
MLLVERVSMNIGIVMVTYSCNCASGVQGAVKESAFLGVRLADGGVKLETSSLGMRNKVIVHSIA